MSQDLRTRNAAAAAILEVEYAPDSAARFASLARYPWSCLLDSCGLDRYDILVAVPRATLITRGPLTEVRTADGVTVSPADPFALVTRAVEAAAPLARGDLPFAGGAVGYFGYELGRRLERLGPPKHDDVGLPDMAIGIYDECIIVDHEAERAWLVAQRGSESPLVRVAHASKGTEGSIPPSPFSVLSRVEPDMDYEQYAAAFARIKRYLTEGDCYQVNLTQRFSAEARGDAWAAYLKLRALNPAPFGAFMTIPGGAVLSSSPERFLAVRERLVETCPIKGTRPRSADPKEDALYAQQLRASLKDQAENVMIVDLLRNDLSKACLPGSVRVPSLFQLQSFATVHHLVSTVRGELEPGVHALDLLRGCFPGGSITGAPKVRAMQIIEELEPCRRGVYCGSIGYIGFNGDMDCNIALRTFMFNGRRLYCAAGGGIVMDSVCRDEYQESLDKAAAMLKLFDR
jgi:para-aminobenzoate synthetase component 1